jgi:hypothetical protein
MKNLKPALFFFITCTLICSFQTVNAQDSSNVKKDYKNTIHFNLTNIAIFKGKSFVIGYERRIKRHQSFTINIGTTALPSLNLVDTDSLKIARDKNNTGFNLSVDYRFYLAKENKYDAPHGVYVGPYYSYNYFNNKGNWDVQSTSGSYGSLTTEMKLNIHTVGAELGYQFLFWKNRISLDFIMIGPGLAFYNLKSYLKSNFTLTEEDKEKVLKKLGDALNDRFPGWNEISTSDSDNEFQTKGSTDISSFGYRFMIQVGFRF